jgi:predicted ATPase
MKSLKLQRLLISSDLEKSARIVQFNERKTVILGENDTGKSCLIKSIYAAFGADAYKTNDNWDALKTNLLVEFTVNDVPYRVMRSGSFFALFGGHVQALWSG